MDEGTLRTFFKKKKKKKKNLWGRERVKKEAGGLLSLSRK